MKRTGKTQGEPGGEADLPLAPGPDGTHEEWRAWGEAMTRAGKLAKPVASSSPDGKSKK